MSRVDFDCIVVGGGPAGMMAAGTAAQSGAVTLLCEKNKRTGTKLLITGKGRCNITNNSSIKALIDNISGQKSFMYSAFSRFSPEDTMDFFEALGVELKTERGNRVFPKSDRAYDIVKAMRSYVKTSGAETRSGTSITKIITKAGGALGVVTPQGTLYAPCVIVATGGLSYPLTGSTGDGYTFAQELGHRIIKPRASLVGLKSSDTLCGECAGLTLKNIKITLFKDNVAIYSDFGELLFTHDGVSGPVVLSASAHIRDIDKAYSLVVDLKPALTAEVLDRRVIRDFDENKNKAFKNSLDKLLPASLRAQIVKKSSIEPDTPINAITKAERGELVKLLKGLVLKDIKPCLNPSFF